MLPAIQKQWPAPATHYEKRNKELEDYEQLGGQRNPYASANAATEMQNTIQAAVATGMASMRDKNAQALTAREEGMQDQINKLTSAIALIAKEQSKFMKAIANKENTPPRRRKRRYSTDSSDDSSSKEEPTPPPKPPKRKKKRKRGKKEKKIEYNIGDEFQIGMEFDKKWTYKKEQKFLGARGKFWLTKTLPVLKHRRKHLKEQLKSCSEGSNKYKTSKKALKRVKKLIKKRRKEDE